MMHDQGIPEMGLIDVGVYFRGRDGLVAKHLLHRAQSGSAFDQMGREGMTERMRADILVQSTLLSKVLDQHEDHHPGELSSTSIQKEDIPGIGIDIEKAPLVVEIHRNVFNQACKLID